MKNIWDYDTKPLTELLEAIVDNRGKTVPTTETGRILIATNCVTNNTLFPVYEKVRFISDETYETWFRAHPIPGDIIFVNKGTPGKVCMVPDPIEFCIAQDMIALRANDKEIYNKYLFAVLRSERIQKQIYNTNVGDVIPHFKKQFLDQLLIPIPPREIQEFIGNLYYQLSYKIELNKQINDNLEQQAQNIFNHYFIDNPIELGSYSEGVLTDIAVYLNGLAMQKFRPEGSDFGLPVLKIKELGQRSCDNNSDRCSSLIKEEYIVNDGDVIFSWSGTLLVDLWCGGKCGLNQHLFKVTSDTYPKWFYYFWTKHHLDNFIRVAKDKAVTMGHIKRTELEKANIIVPTQDKLSEINRIMSPIITEIINHRVEMRKLAQLRDSLLPQLMSGELKINEIDC